MQGNTFTQVYGGNFLSHWTRVSQCRKPVIAAVNGFAVNFVGICFAGAAIFNFSLIAVGRWLRAGHDVRHYHCG